MSFSPAPSVSAQAWYNRMLEDNTFADVVCWGPQGDCFVIKDLNEFTKSILPRMFKHSNFASFVRQLNKYDFHKVSRLSLLRCSFGEDFRVGQARVLRDSLQYALEKDVSSQRSIFCECPSLYSSPHSLRRSRVLMTPSMENMCVKYLSSCPLTWTHLAVLSRLSVGSSDIPSST